MTCGEEAVADSCKAVAAQALQQKVIIKYEGHAGMPHIFPLLAGMGQVPHVGSWAHFCQQYSKEASPKGANISLWIDHNTYEELDMRSKDLVSIDVKKVRLRMMQGMRIIER